MADFYMDTDGGSDANNGTTWALGKLTLEGLLAVMSAGDRGWIQGAAADTDTVNRTYTSPGSIYNPCIITGVVDGTSNEPPVPSDIAVTLPVISTTGTDADNIFTGDTVYNNLEFSTGDRTSTNASDFTFNNCHMKQLDRWTMSTSSTLVFNNGVYEPTGSEGSIGTATNSSVYYNDGSWIFTGASNLTRLTSNGNTYFSGVDLSGLTAKMMGSSSNNRLFIRNCELPSTYTIMTHTPTAAEQYAEVIASNDTSSQAADSSIPEYRYEDGFGTIFSELTIVRTGGADDGATGLFSYAMTTKADRALESSNATLKSPWMSVWLDGGSNTLTVHIANDSASTDYNEDEAWVEFYTPSASDTAQHDQNFDASDARLFASSTAITDDTGSTWGSGGNNHQQFSATVTTGFEGFAYARLHLAKRQASPDTLYLDPAIVVT